MPNLHAFRLLVVALLVVLLPCSSAFGEKGEITVTGKVRSDFKKGVLEIDAGVAKSRKGKIKLYHKVLKVPSVSPLILFKGDLVEVTYKYTGGKKGHGNVLYAGTFISWGADVLARQKEAGEVRTLSGRSHGGYKEKGPMVLRPISRAAKSRRIAYYQIKGMPDADRVFIINKEIYDVRVKPTGEFKNGRLWFEFVAWGSETESKMAEYRAIPTITVGDGVEFEPVRYGKLQIRVPDKDRIVIDKEMKAYYQVINKNEWPKVNRRLVKPVDAIIRPLGIESKSSATIREYASFVDWGPKTKKRLVAIAAADTKKWQQQAAKKRAAAEREQQAKAEAQKKKQARAQAVAAKQQKAKDFYYKFNAIHKIDTWPNARKLHANPYQYQGSRLGMYVRFVKMWGKREAYVFSGGQHFTLVNVPTRMFSAGQAALVACKVLNSNDGVARLKYIDAYLCPKSFCNDVMYWKGR